MGLRGVGPLQGLTLNKEVTQLAIKALLTTSSSDLADINTNTAATVTELQTLNTVDFATEAKQDAQSVLIGAVNEAAPGTDTASSGLNGRLQRIAQRLTSLIALLPTSLGQKTMANSLAVTIASDQTALAISGTVSVTDVATETTLLQVKSFADYLSQGLSYGDGTASMGVSYIISGNDNLGNNYAVNVDTDGHLQIDILSSALPSGAATSTIQTDGTQKTQLVDGAGDVADIKLLSAVPLSTDKGLVTQSIIHGLNSGGGGTYVDVKVNPSGKLLVTADLEQGGVAVGAANPVQVTLANTGANATAVKVDGSATTQPVSGTVAATQSGNWSTRTQDGSGNAVTSHLVGASRGIDVSILDGSGNQITSFGGGTQYTEDDAAAANPVGNALLARRRDSLSTETTTDGDMTALNSTAKGELYVKHVDAITVTGVSTEATLLNVLADLDTLVASAVLDGSAIDPDMIVVGGSDGANYRQLKTDSSGNLQVDVLTLPSVSISGTVTVDSELSAAAALADATANPTVTSVGTFLQGYNGSTWDRLRSDTTYGLDVDVTRVSGNVTIIQGTATNLKAQAEVYQGGVAVGAAAPLQVSLANHGANATAVKVDGSAVTQPVSVSALALAQGSTTSGQTGPLVQGAVTTAAPSYTTAQTSPLSLTTGGALRTQIDNSPTVFTRPSPTSSSTSALTTAESTAYATNLVVKASAGRLYAISGYNSKTSDQFIQIHNTTSLPADASVPKRILRVYADSNFFFDFGEFGLYCATGITVCNSTTGPTKTIEAADIWFQADYK